MRLRLCKARDRARDRIEGRGSGRAEARAFAALRLLAAGWLAGTACGCSGPILSFRAQEAPAAPEPAVTGSLPKRPTNFGRDLDDEDWRRAHGALSLALDPQGNGRPVKWENPESAMRGSINPTGLPYVAGDEICRDFLASVISGPRSRFLRGTGCKASGGEWALKRLRSAKA